VIYWCEFFGKMRVHRRAIAESILASPDLQISPQRRQELFNALDHVCALFEGSLEHLAELAKAEETKPVGFDAPDDERYRRIKARSMRVLQELEQDRARAASPAALCK
jgi:hypothetical protein